MVFFCDQFCLRDCSDVASSHGAALTINPRPRYYHGKTSRDWGSDMRLFISALIALVSASMLATSPLLAQDSAIYVVSYIETAPAAAATAAGLLRQFADAARKQPGNMRFELLQRVSPSNPFAAVAVWKDRKGYNAHVVAPDTNALRDKIKPHLISAIDDRLHSGMDVAGAATRGAPGAVHGGQHGAVPPPRKDDD